MAHSGFAPSNFGKQPDTLRNSLLRRVGLFVKKPYLDWDHTQTQLNPHEEQRLRQQFLSKRERNLTGRESGRDLQLLRSKITRNRAEAERIAAGGAISRAQMIAAADDAAHAQDDHDSQLSHPRAMQSTLQQNTEAKTIPMKFDGSNFTLSAHIAPGEGFEVRTLEAGDLQACLDEAAYSFASGDEISAEAVLLQACEDFKEAKPQLYPYLLDLYRITQQTQPYAAAASLYSQASKVPMGMLDMVREQPRKPIHAAVARVLTADDVYRMDVAFQDERQGGGRCEFRFDGITAVAHDALKPLGQLLDRIASTPHEFAFAGLATLITVLEQQAKAMLASQSAELHRARFCASRLAGNIKLFEEAAADFGEAARIPAPSWRPPRCMLLVPIDNPYAQSAGQINGGNLHFPIAGTLSKVQLNAQLQLQNSFLAHANAIDIDCSALHCLSFDAAALLVDWVRAASSVGNVVKLHGLHRLCERLLLSVGAEQKWLVLSHPYA